MRADRPNYRYITPVTLTVLAGAVGFAANIFDVPVFGGTALVFGSFFPLLIVFAFGPRFGAIAATVAAAGTLISWSHPVGLVCFSGEAIAVGWLSRRRGWHPLSADAAYWVLVGTPIAALYTYFSTAIPFPGNWSITLRMPVNGLVCALAAYTAYDLLSERWPDRSSGTVKNVPLLQILFHRFGLLATLPIIALGFYAGRAFDVRQRVNAAVEVSDAADDLASSVERHLDSHRQIIATLADQLSASRMTDPDALALQLDTVRRQFPGFLTLLVADQRGAVVATASAATVGRRTGSSSELTSVADREYFQRARNDQQVFVSDVFPGRGLGHDLIVAISAPVLGADGTVNYVVEGSLNLARLSHELANSHLSTARDLVVVDRKFRVVSSVGQLNLAPLTSFTQESLALAAAKSETLSFTHDQRRPGERRPDRQLAASATVSKYGWTVFLQEPLWITQQPVAAYYLSMLIGSLVAIGCALALARVTATSVTRPLRQLLRTTHALANPGSAPPPLQILSGPTEVVLLSHDVHTAALLLQRGNLALEQSNTELRNLLASLDQKIHERTAELAEARTHAESANRAKSEFLASMSHELRTPLNVILGNANLLEDGTMGPLSARQLDSLRGIDESGRHLLSLINDILDLSKVEAGMLELDHTDVGAIEICDTSLRFISVAAEKKRLTLVKRHDFVEETTFVADGRRVKQILVNLLSNAVKFTPEGGTITLGVSASEDRGAIDFTVTDSGIGIPLDRQRRLFRPFVQIDSRLSRDYAGTGLGLALVKQLADLHGGSVGLVSAPDQGSTFTVSLPLRRDTPSGAPFVLPRFASPVEMIRSNPRLLVAEDHDTNLAVLRAYFSSQTCRVTYARDGFEVVETALADVPDLILMDVQMPRMDGLEAITRLRADPRTARVPIICITALAMVDDRQRCMAAGANDYLCKPVNFRVLTSSINALISPLPPTNAG